MRKSPCSHILYSIMCKLNHYHLSHCAAATWQAGLHYAKFKCLTAYFTAVAWLAKLFAAAGGVVIIIVTIVGSSIVLGASFWVPCSILQCQLHAAGRLPSRWHCPWHFDIPVAMRHVLQRNCRCKKPTIIWAGIGVAAALSARESVGIGLDGGHGCRQ